MYINKEAFRPFLTLTSGNVSVQKQGMKSDHAFLKISQKQIKYSNYINIRINKGLLYFTIYWN